ncbi:receptor-type tyrosine-protein phosphatase U isoform X9 [Pan paniscus]|uniref:receptor-type tyrosine-protein phosphatase U isoform X8 n=1 Tax=Pan troglodytes TaxID=9598 RepID=UPI0007DBE03B|nr:receptor-type tyrosine-protein phosphatase U isoform X8 [Pan troglodytes]XP_054951797.1 receptor-type tyrosine-protein phosphatase U isoform X8 [Pan paniscus]
MARAQALVLALTFQLCAPETETPAAGCTFEEASDPAVPCEYSQAQYDDFQWEQVRIHPGTRAPADLPHGSYLMVNTSQHAPGQRAHVIFQSLSENDTHCVQFSYFLYSRDGHSPGTLGVYVRVNGGPLGSAVWNMTGSHGRQWHQAELAVSTFWPNEYQVLFEALISPDRRGYMGLDDILLLSYPCAKAPHFSRLGDVEVNAGQNASFQCMAAGRAAEAERFLLQRQSGALVPAAGVRHISHRRFLATFPLAAVSRAEQDLYRCVSQAPRGAGVSNFAELIVKEPPTPIAPPQLLRAGPTYLIIQLNTNSIIGDGPIVRKEIEYRMARGPWAEVHAVSLQTYKLWHLDPDTEYEISVLLTRPGDGGTGRPGPPLISRTKCAEPMRAPKGLAFAEIQARQLTLQWEPLGYNVTRCHTYTVSLCYHYTLGSSHNQTIRECVKTEQGVSRYTIKNLLPYRNVHVRLVLTNPEGRKEGKEVTFQTDEDVPSGIAAESLTFTPLEDMIFLKWEEPQEPNGLITQYEISYQSIESSDPAVNVPGPRRTISKLRNETYHVFSNLHPGTTYLFSVRARTGKGFGQAALTEITTNISAPSFDYADMPSPLGESENTITVLLRPAQGRGAPIRRDHYAYSYYPKPVNMTKATVNYRQEKTHMMSAVDRSFTDQSTLQEDERLGLSFMDTHGYSTRGDQRSGGVTEASSLLGGSPRRPCGRKGSPYHTGQLHPAVRVADLLQHINQMKTAEGYGFKQEYESFFEGWDATKKKDKVKGSRQEPMPAYDRHRVKLHPMLGDPNADYINANYIDIRINREGYHRSNHFIATQGPKPEMVYDFWRMVWQEHCSSIVMITKLVEVGRVKCSRYWPEDSDTYGDIKITLVKTETLAEYVVRTFALERRGYSARHEVRQFHFTAWPEHGVPYHATGLLAFIRRVKASTPPDAGPIVIHCSAGTGRTGCYIVLDVMLDMAECEGVVDIYNCVKTLCSRRVNMIQTEEQYIFIHDAILEACLCGETTIPVSEFKATYKEMIRIDPQSNSSQLREEFQTLNSVTPPLDVEECSIALLPRNRDKNRSMDVLPPDRCLPFLISTDGDPNNYINAALTDSYTRSAAFIVTLHPLQSTTPDFWRLVYDYGCTSIVMLNQLNQSNSAWPCLQYWPEPGRQQYGLMEVEFMSGTADEDLVARVFRVQNISRLQEGHLLVRHFQFLRWSAYRDTPDSKKAFLHLLAEVDKWQAESGDGRTIVHCLNGGGRSGTFCACATVLEMIRCHNLVDVFFAAKTLRNYKPNMVETMDQYHFCYDVALEYLEGLESR